ncbi:hypothetical protein [Aquimarina muelleri]|uniref:Uncharacterized protein n=1 Tax=Aquimarina muelleri TaxID=279356 RepID=A0A918N2H6_9FLAO|nr:hypothetical protein [Aquimarina muelleri]MCX2761361.1 hypothetical protein [Aquimarina muelleri]GGX13075.1 hypothetical protein GCM10007384_13330 [Aquimarina muelleri]
MVKKEIIIGFIIGLLINCLGFILCLFIFSTLSGQEYTFTETMKASIKNGSLGSLIALGAIPNLITFFYFLRKNNIYRARGILLVCLIAAICIAISKFESY